MVESVLFQYDLGDDMNAAPNLTIPRERIVASLQAAIASYPLVVVTAPVGYGKTIAARELLNAYSLHTAPAKNRIYPLPQHPFEHVCYLPIYPGESAPAYMWKHRQELFASLGSPLAPLIKQTSFPTTLQQCAVFIEKTRPILQRSPHLFVIDDYHFIHSHQYDALLEVLVRAAMPGFSLVIFSRTPTNLPIDELCMKGLCKVFNKEFLTFSQDDTINLFKEHGIKETTVAKQAWATSEGWAAALWLHSQQYLANGALAPQRNFHQLLQQTVFSGYSHKDQVLLLKLSILDSFTIEQAAMVTQEIGIGQRISALCESNAFLHYLPETASYRMHNLFRSFCADAFDNLPAALCDKPSLYRRAAEWNLQNNDFVGGIYYLAKAQRDEDLERILELYEQSYAHGAMHIDSSGMAKVGLNIPWHIRLRKPIGYISFVLYYALEVSAKQGIALLQEAEEQFSQAKLPIYLLRQIAGYIHFIKGVLREKNLRVFCGHMEKAWNTSHKPLAISSKSIPSNNLPPHLGFIYLRNKGDYQSLLADTKNGWKSFYLLSNGGGAGCFTLMEAEYLLETANLEQAELKAEQTVAEAELHQNTQIIINAYFVLARLYIATKRVAEALTALEKIQSQFHLATSYVPPNLVNLIQSYLYACLGKTSPNATFAAIEKNENGITPETSFTYIVQSKILLTQNNFLAVLGCTPFLYKEYGKLHCFLGTLHTLVLEVIATWHLYGPEQSKKLTGQMLEQATADNLTFLLGEYGEHIIPILTVWLKENPTDTFAKRVLAYANAYPTLPNSLTKKSVKAQRLTERELKMLNLVAQGKSSMQIANSFGIQRVTVTKALGNAYKKLGVKNRSQAIRKLLE